MHLTCAINLHIFWFDFPKAINLIRNNTYIYILIQIVMKIGKKQHTMLAQTQTQYMYSVLSALHVCGCVCVGGGCVCVCVRCHFRILHWSFYLVN